MRKEIIEYAKTITRDTRLTEIAKVIKNLDELAYILKTLEKKHE